MRQEKKTPTFPPKKRWCITYEEKKWMGPLFPIFGIIDLIATILVNTFCDNPIIKLHNQKKNNQTNNQWLKSFKK